MAVTLSIFNDKSNFVAMLCVKYFKHNNIELGVRINECYFYYYVSEMRVLLVSGDLRFARDVSRRHVNHAFVFLLTLLKAPKDILLTFLNVTK